MSDKGSQYKVGDRVSIPTKNGLGAIKFQLSENHLKGSLNDAVNSNFYNAFKLETETNPIDLQNGDGTLVNIEAAGTGARATVDVGSDGKIRAVDVDFAGSGYALGDKLRIPAGILGVGSSDVDFVLRNADHAGEISLGYNVLLDNISDGPTGQTAGADCRCRRGWSLLRRSFRTCCYHENDRIR